MCTNEHGANGNCRVEVAAEVHIANNTCIRPTLHRFEFINDFHGTHFWRTAHRSCWKRCSQHINWTKVFTNVSRHLRSHVHHVAVALECHQFIHVHGTKLGNSTNVVASQVHQHDVLGNFFGVLAQFGSKLAIVFVCTATLARSSNWSAYDSSTLQLHHWLWGTSHDGDIVVFHVIHVWTWVHLAQHSIHVKWFGIKFNVKPLRQDHLKNVASANVFFRRLDRALVLRTIDWCNKLLLLVFIGWRFNRQI